MSAQNSDEKNSKLYLLLNLGLLSALGPFVTDFYLPALPGLMGVFSTTSALVQLSITCSLIGLAFGQLLMGPLSDKYGRKRILQLSLGLFIIATIACLLAWDIYSFITFRLVQGIAGSGGIVIARAIVADLFEGEELAKFFALLGVVQGMAPICAPIFGGILLQYTNWHGIFSVLLALGVLLFATIFFFKESLPKQRRISGGFLESFSFLHILKNKQFMLYALTQGFAMGIMFSFIGASSFIFEEHFGLNELECGLCFAGVALCISIGAGSTPLFKSEIRALKLGIIGIFVCGICTFLVLNSNPSLLFTEIGFGMTIVFLGLVLPTSSALAMELERKNAGNASAILGFVIFAFGGIIAPLTSVGRGYLYRHKRDYWDLLCECGDSRIFRTQRRKRLGNHLCSRESTKNHIPKLT